MKVSDSQREWEKRLANAWRGEDLLSDDDEEARIVPDGGKLRVTMSMMDAVQRSIRDAGLSDYAGYLTDAQRSHFDCVQRWAEHFDARQDRVIHDRENDSTGQSDYEDWTANAWKNPPSGMGGLK